MRIILRLFSVFLSVILIFGSTVAAHESSEEDSIPLYSVATMLRAEASSVQYAAPEEISFSLNFASKFNQEGDAIVSVEEIWSKNEITTEAKIENEKITDVPEEAAVKEPVLAKDVSSDTSTKNGTIPAPPLIKSAEESLSKKIPSVVQQSSGSFASQNSQALIEKYGSKASEDAITVLAKLLYGEANNAPKMEKAAVIWTILNRVDAGYGELVNVATNRSHYNGYNKNHPVTDENRSLCLDVLCRYYAEKDGCSNVGRVIPSDYMWFRGDGKHNYFRNSYSGGTTWDWSLPNPYEN